MMHSNTPCLDSLHRRTLRLKGALFDGIRLLDRWARIYLALTAVSLALGGRLQAQPVSLPEWLARPEVPVAQRTAMSSPAGDGVTNLVKFALGVPPMANASGALPVPTQGAQEMALEFTLNPQAQGLVLSLEVSDDLKTWTSVPRIIELLRTNPDGTQLVRMREETPPAASRRFGRLRVALIPADFAQIPAGAFTMGDSFKEGWSRELPQHSVTLTSFHMAKTLTTWAEWQAVRAWAVGHGYADLAGMGAGKASDHPVHSVSWYEVVKWCNARSEMHGLRPCYYTDNARTIVYRTGTTDVTNAQVDWSANGYRLPTEAEWEYAARGGFSGRRFPWGDTITHTRANYFSDDGYAYDVSVTRGFHPTYNSGASPLTSPVAAFPANGFGMHDMAGNLGQWCWDWYGSYTANAQTSPQGPATGTARLRRSGSWGDPAYYSRTAIRGYYPPNGRSTSYGFRCVRSSVP